MTKNELVSLYQNLNRVGNLKGVKFAYAISRNIAIIKPEIESLEKSSAQTEDYEAFEKLRIALVEKHAKKDKDGKPIIKENEYEVEDKEKMDIEFEALKTEHQKVWSARETQVKEYNELLKTESEVKLHKVALVDVPADITVQQMHGISAIISEDLPSPYKQ